MGRMDLRLARVGVTRIALAALRVLPSHAHAADVGSPPVATSVYGAAVDLPAGTTNAKLSCTHDVVPTRDFAAMVVERPDGSILTWMLETLVATGGATNVRAFTLHQSLLPTPLVATGSGGGASVSGDLGGTRLHAGYASWGAPATCSLFVDDAPVAVTPLSPADAVSARLDEMGGGVGVTENQTGLFLGAGAALSLTHEAHGFEVGWAFLGQPGVIHAFGPDPLGTPSDQHIQPGTAPSVLITQPASGTWTHGFDVATQVSSYFPPLWILDLPR